MLDEALGAVVIQGREAEDRQAGTVADDFTGDVKAFGSDERHSEEDDGEETESNEEEFTGLESFHDRI